MISSACNHIRRDVSTSRRRIPSSPEARPGSVLRDDSTDQWQLCPGTHMRLSSRGRKLAATTTSSRWNRGNSTDVGAVIFVAGPWRPSLSGFREPERKRGRERWLSQLWRFWRLSGGGSALRASSTRDSLLEGESAATSPHSARCAEAPGALAPGAYDLRNPVRTGLRLVLAPQT